MMMRRKIITIDEDKCDGCGNCVPACAEGALEIVDGKARLVSDVYCDGLGACLGECPQGAITIEEREAEEFDLEAAERHIGEREQKTQEPEGFTGCPGAASRLLNRGEAQSEAASQDTAQTPSQLGNWPVQLHLVPVRAPYFDGSKVLIGADCMAFAFGDFHRRFLSGTTLLVGCPKLDDADLYRRKLAQIFIQNEVSEVEVAYMEVPCCHGLVRLVQRAIEDSEKKIPLTLNKIGVKGNILETSAAQMEKSEGGS
jgi:Fe-S-cluster-containing hydrogenase component 2